jgi:ABC-type sugar transport system permease subunit
MVKSFNISEGTATRFVLKLDRWSPAIMIIPALVALLIVRVYPSLDAIRMSFFDIQLLKPDRPFIGIEHYKTAFSDPVTYRIIGNTLVFAVFSLLFGGTLAMLTALELNKRYPERGLFRALYLAPWVTPPLVTAAVWNQIFSYTFSPINSILLRLHLIEAPLKFLGDTRVVGGIFSIPMLVIIIINTWNVFPFLMVMFLAGLQTISPELYEAASIDGANNWQKFWRVTLPSLMPVVATSILLQGIWQFNNFNISYLVTRGGPIRLTEVMAVSIYTEAFSKYDYGYAATVSVIMLMVSIIPSALYLRDNFRHR